MDAWQCLDGPCELGEYFTVLDPLLPGPDRGGLPCGHIDDLIIREDDVSSTAFQFVH